MSGPRAASATAGIAGLVLAAGTASRYRAAGGGLPTKLLLPMGGEPLVRRVARVALAAGLSPVVVVTGHAGEAVAAALGGLSLQRVQNPAFAAGLSTSLRAGLAALGGDVPAAVVLLGDMPLVGPEAIAALCAAARRNPASEAVVPVVDGERGNPVLLRRALFERAAALTGDEGARRLLRDPTVPVAELPMDNPALRFDIDEAGDLLR